MKSGVRWHNVGVKRLVFSLTAKSVNAGKKFNNVKITEQMGHLTAKGLNLHFIKTISDTTSFDQDSKMRHKTKAKGSDIPSPLLQTLKFNTKTSYY